MTACSKTVRFLLGLATIGSTVLCFPQSTVFAGPPDPNNPDGSGHATVTASVPGNAADYELTFISTETSTQFPQNTAIGYKLSYRSLINNNGNVTLQAQWSQGTLAGAVSPSVDILDYVSGSGTNAYNSTAPVIDTVNRTITWTIANLPATATQSVTFSLKTNASYTGSSVVNFNVAGRLTAPGVTLPDQTVNQTYLYASSGSSSPSSGSSGSSSSTTSTQTAAPVASAQPPASPGLRITNVQVIAIDTQSATILVTTNLPSPLTIYYGRTPKTMLQSIISPTQTTHHQVTMTGLLPGQIYFFKPVLGANQPKPIETDIYTFKTATSVNKPTILADTVVVTSHNTVLYGNPVQISSVIIPENLQYEFTFRIANAEHIASVVAQVDDSTVLGWHSPGATDANTNRSNVAEISSGQFLGKLQSPKTNGSFIVSIQIHDYSGNIIDQPLFRLTVTKPLTVIKKDQTPIEDAQIKLSYYNDKTRLYEPMASQVFVITNPLYSNPDGTTLLVLSPGKYKAIVTAIGFDQATNEFTINDTNPDPYPTIVLTPQHFSIMTYLVYYLTALQSLIAGTVYHLHNFASSFKYFDIFAKATLVTTTLLSIMLLAKRLGVSIVALPLYCLYQLRLLEPQTKKRFIVGKVIDQSAKHALSRAHVYLIDPVANAILSEAWTNEVGEFFLPKKPAVSYKIAVFKPGYFPHPFEELSPQAIDMGELTVALEPEQTITIRSYLRGTVGLATNFAFAICLCGCFILAIVFSQTIGLKPTLPFLVIAMTNLIVWLIFSVRRVMGGRGNSRFT